MFFQFFVCMMLRNLFIQGVYTNKRFRQEEEKSVTVLRVDDADRTTKDREFGSEKYSK